MWTTRLLILGLVGWLQPVHGYEVHRELMSWGVTHWGGLKRGSIYHGLKKLARDGDLAIDSVEKVDSRPARTTYRLTPQGGQAFFELLRDKLWGNAAATADFWVAWTFVTVLPHREAAAMLRNRAGLLRDYERGITAKLRATEDAPPGTHGYMPPHIVSSLETHVAKNRVDIEWCEVTARRIEAGELYEENPGLKVPDAERWKEHIGTMTDPDA